MLRKILIGVLIIAALLIGVYLIFVLRAQPLPDRAVFTRENNDVLVIAHQGGDGERPSNTMSAFTHAVELGVDVLEMDIHSTSDGVLVVIHDDTVDRTTNGTGNVNDLTFAEIQALDAGYNWNTLDGRTPETHESFRGQGVTIPALEEVIQTFSTLRMVIEIKQQTPSIAQPLCDMLREYDMTEKVIVASFADTPIYEFRQICPEVPTSAVESEVRTFYVLNLIGLSRAYASSAYAFQVPEYSGDIHVVTPGFIASAHTHNIAVQTWTINDVETMHRMIDLGVDGIITDEPTLLLDLLGRS